MGWMIRLLLGLYARQLEDAIARNLRPNPGGKVARVPETPDEKAKIETFTFLAHDESGMKIGPTGAHRLVCFADSGAKVVILGRKSQLKNINAVLEAGLPCTVRCETYPASRTVGLLFGHTHWVRECSTLEVAPSPSLGLED